MSYAIVEAPSTLGLRSTGVERLPETLLAAGLADRLGASRFGRVAALPRNPQQDAFAGLLNPPMLALRCRGRFGLLFVDGHADFYSTETNPNGEGASMDRDLGLSIGTPVEIVSG